MKINFLFLKLFFLFLLNSCVSSSKHINGFKRELISEEIHLEGFGSNLITRENKKEVTLIFFEKFNDTLELIIDNKVIFKKYFHEELKPNISSGYSGVSIVVNIKNKNSKVIIKLLAKQKYIDFYIDNTYPAYAIHRYNNHWYINGKLHSMKLK